MDISTITANSSELAIIHPATEEPIGLVLSILPLSDPKVKAVTHQIQTKLMRKRKQRFTPQEIEQNLVDIMVAAISGLRWEEGASWNGEQPKYSEKVIREIIEPDDKDWLRDQIQESIGDTASFFTS